MYFKIIKKIDKPVHSICCKTIKPNTSYLPEKGPIQINGRYLPVVAKTSDRSLIFHQSSLNNHFTLQEVTSNRLKDGEADLRSKEPFNHYFISDFVDIQRKSFFTLLEKGLIDEFSKRNPISNLKKTLEIFFYPEYYQLTPPEYSPNQAIIKSKSYISRLYIPVQLTDKNTNTIKLKWVFIGNIPLMTKRGHFILNGCARVIVNQMIRSPGLYYQKKIYENYANEWSEKPENIFERHYADLICNRGTWLRIEMDKDNRIWAQMKKVPKIPIMWLLIAMGLSEKIIFKRIIDSQILLYNLKDELTSPDLVNTEKTSEAALKLPYIKSPPAAWAAIYNLVVGRRKKLKVTKEKKPRTKALTKENKNTPSLKDLIISSNEYLLSGVAGCTPEGRRSKEIISSPNLPENPLALRAKPHRAYGINSASQSADLMTINPKGAQELGRKWLFNKFMNPRTYDLGEIGRLNFNNKLNLSIDLNQTTLTPQDLLLATDHLILVSKGLRDLDDIDHLKNRRVRTSGELIQLQIGIGLVRLEKTIREKLNKADAGLSHRAISYKLNSASSRKGRVAKVEKNSLLPSKILVKSKSASPSLVKTSKQLRSKNGGIVGKVQENAIANNYSTIRSSILRLSNIMNTKPFNGALKEFFGSNPLSQFMDQINPLAELTHKRRLSSMGPGGVTRDSATLEIRGIHPSHYGRICPVETPEGKNTGLVNSLTAYARVNSKGYIETPFYRVYRGQVQKKAGMFFFSAKQEEKIKLGASDLYTSDIGFLPLASIPVRIVQDFTKISRNELQYVGVAPIQMISIATSLIPFFEHDDGNRALMGSNMQRQAVPILKPQRPIVGTGLEVRAVSDSGHVLQAKSSGVVTYVSSSLIKISVR